ncbi:MAG: hypothetical protein HY344_00145 [Candidatus Levybacteria bacterium]|nr:hypothetical protein [Candidatus Levybacteria bacterium]
MLKPIALANASAVVALGIYVLCWILALVAPDFLFVVAKSWFHAFNIDSAQTAASLNIVELALGAVALSVLVWVTFYAGAVLYNKWAE